MSAQDTTTTPELSPSTFPTNKLIADVLYASYISQRSQNPEISAERWRKVFTPQIADVLEARYQQALKKIKLSLRTVPVGLKRNYDVRCSVMDVSFGSSGEDDLACGRPTVQCPGCGEWSGSCDDHLFEQPDGTRVCIECDGSVQFRRMAPDSAEIAELAGKASA